MSHYGAHGETWLSSAYLEENKIFRHIFFFIHNSLEFQLLFKDELRNVLGHHVEPKINSWTSLFL
jgi:hypothetical protein